MRKVNLKETTIYPAVSEEIKVQFKVGINDSEDIFTYTYAVVGIGITPYDDPKAPGLLRSKAGSLKTEVTNSILRLQEQLETRDTIYLVPENRIKRTKDFDTSYVKSNYGYATCVANDADDYNKLSQIEIGESVFVNYGIDNTEVGRYLELASKIDNVFDFIQQSGGPEPDSMDIIEVKEMLLTPA